MNLISRKLRSKTGASMLIAILFMMFCLFVGGSVLAAATANGYRVEHMSDQQDFLSQRSAGSLIADEIDGGKQVSELNLEVGDLTTKYLPLKHLDGGGWEEDPSRAKTEERTITFEAPFSAEKSMTVMQRLMYETAVCRYLKEQGITEGQLGFVEGTVGSITVELEGFYYNGTAIQNLSQFWYKYSSSQAAIGGQVAIQGKRNDEGTPFTQYTAYFTSGDQENMYDFLVTFGDMTQMTVSADAYMGTTEIPRPVERVEHATKGFVEVTYANTRTDITWEWAYIEKGAEG